MDAIALRADRHTIETVNRHWAVSGCSEALNGRIAR